MNRDNDSPIKSEIDSNDSDQHISELLPPKKRKSKISKKKIAKNKNFCTDCEQLFKSKKKLNEHICRPNQRSKRPRLINNKNDLNPEISASNSTKFNENEEFTVLVQNHKRMFQCLKCNKVFNSKGYCHDHYLAHLNQGLRCVHCQKPFDRRDSWSKHERKCNKQGESESTEKTDSRFIKFMLHDDYVKTATGRFKCLRCNKDFGRKDYCREHTMMHLNETAYQCQFCHKNLAGRDIYNRHLFICKLNPDYDAEEVLEIEHKVAEVRESVEKNLERIKATNTNGKIIENLHYIVTKGEKYVCLGCARVCPRKNKIKDHCVSHMSGNGPKYQCPYCFKRYEFADYLQTHVRRSCQIKRAIVNKPDECVDIAAKPDPILNEEANPDCWNADDLNKSLLPVNELAPVNDSATSLPIKQKSENFEFVDGKQFFKITDKEFVCLKCNKPFVRKSSCRHHYLVQHLTTQKLFSCHICYKTFKTRPSLVKHFSFGSCFRRANARNRMGKTQTDNAAEDPDIIVNNDKIQFVEGKQYARVDAKFECLHCHKTYLEKYRCKRHYRVHLNKKPYQCGRCYLSFKLRSNLIEHLRICRVFKGQKDVRTSNILPTRDEVEISVAENDDEKFDDSFKFEENEQFILTKHGLFSCIKCRRQYYDKFSCMEHYRLHLNARPYKCNDCGKSFKLRKSLMEHSTLNGCTASVCPSEVLSTEVQFTCNLCGKSFKSEDDLKVCAEKHEKLPNKKCEKCELQFYYKSEYMNHIQEMHCGPAGGDALSLKCPHCHKIMLDENHLKWHVKMVHDVQKLEYVKENGRYKCKECEKTFALSQGFRRHWKGEHRPPSVCHICGKLSKSDAQHHAHLITHNNDQMS